MRYTYDDDEDEDGASASDATSGARRSTRHQSARTTPFESGPTYTASGRQINKPRTGGYGESLLSHAPENASTDELAPEYSETPRDEEDSEPVRNGGRATRSAAGPAMNGASNPRKRKHIDGYNDIDGMSEEDDAAPSGDEWDSDMNEADDTEMPDVDADADDDKEGPSEVDDDEEDDEPTSLIVKLKVSPNRLLKRDDPTAAKLETNGRSASKAALDNLDFKSAHHDGDVQATAGAAAPPTALPNGFKHGYTAAQSTTNQTFVSTPPSAASAYPTPASASFPTADAKMLMSNSAVAASAAEHLHQGGVNGLTHSVPQTNGVGALDN